MTLRACTLLILSGLMACAQVREPTGGPVDTSPPRLVDATPPNGTTHFESDRILLTFDERVKLERVGERLVVSPPLEKKPEVRVVGGRSVEVRLRAPLRPDATHVFNIGDAVVDLTEGNAAAGLVYVISTSDHLDSLAIHGRVVEARTGEPVAGIAVLAYSPKDSLAFREGRPDQFTRTDATGAFSLRHLAPGRYMLHALRDQNGDLRYDLPNEELAFLEGPVPASLPGDSMMPGVTLRLFREPAKEQELLQIDVMEEGAFRLVFALPATTVKLTDIARRGGDLEWTYWSSPTKDTIMAWPSDTTLLEEGSYALEVDEATLDTLRYRRPGRMPWSLKAGITSGSHPPGRFVLDAARPIARVDTGHIRLQGAEGPVTFTFSADPDDPRRMVFVTDLHEGQRATLELLPKALIGMYGGTNDTIRAPLGSLASEELGRLEVRFLDELPRGSGNWLLQILDGQGRLVQRIPVEGTPGSVVWERVPPGSYRLRLLHDRNGNGRWDPGLLQTGLAPESVTPHGEPVQVRANWEVGMDWTTPVGP